LHFLLLLLAFLFIHAEHLFKRYAARTSGTFNPGRGGAGIRELSKE
jgi:hypothetical protein